MNAALLQLYVWTMSRRLRNKLAHTMNGNGSKGKSKGKNKTARTDAPSDQPMIATRENISENNDYELRAAIEAALPEAAKLRTQTQLIASEWNVPAIPYQSMGKHDGVALVPKKALPMVLGQVGWTSCRVAALVTEDPIHLGLRGFTRAHVRCSASVIDENNERVIITITRWLVQLGYALPVEQLMAGEQVNMYVTMRKFQIRLPQEYGFPSPPFQAAFVVQQLAKWVPTEAIADVVCRVNDTATFMVHSDYVQTLLEASGREGMFMKDKDGSTDYFLLYLDEEFSLEEAVKLAEADTVCGVCRKGVGTRPRFALRFAKESDLRMFAQDNHLLDTSSHAKWKVQGISPVIGTCGLLAFLTERGFENIDILYQKDLCATFSAEVSGNINDSYCITGGTRFQLRFKATNKVAQDHAKTKSQSSQAAKRQGAPTQSARSAAQQLFYQQHTIKQQSQNISADPKNAPKRIQQTKTGLTPERKQQKGNDDGI